MMQNQQSVLILYAHPSSHRSEINAPLFQAANGLDGVTLVDLYRDYPDYRIDVEREQQRLKEHDVVVFLFPLFWYSTPSILKEWQDLVLEYGFAYGQGGDALHGKRLVCVVSAGGAQSAYQEQGYNHFSIRELLRPLEQTARLIGMQYLPPLVLFGARTAVEELRVGQHIERWKRLLTSLVRDDTDWRPLLDLETCNSCFDDGEPRS
ncbi:NAD(P)H-dependent oxidoreductase [Ferrimonas sp. SCSIO 43195]|nr:MULTISPECIES: NAD(P)H-dependent oxidoreductase [Ferrimonas]USD39717.1 NAD(P)H-dependent oxidoreductase [Ferrimonas sp. SCSIO 43195]